MYQARQKQAYIEMDMLNKQFYAISYKVSSCHSQRGFNLIELMVVIAIIGILAAIALPNYANTVRNNCMTTRANKLVSSLHLARSEAVLRRADVDIFGNNGTGGNEFGAGWEVSSGNETILNETLLDCPNTTLNSIPNIPPSRRITYHGNGFAAHNAIIRIDICDDRAGETGRRITIPITGRPQINRNFNCP